jgi:hypothetical protein
LGGEQESVESAYGQMAQKARRIAVTVQVGKFAVHDVFDNNAYAMDSRADFMNWSIWAAGAFGLSRRQGGAHLRRGGRAQSEYWALRVG